MKCLDCSFFEEKSGMLDPGVGICHRYPPTEVGHGEGQSVLTRKINWCGEFKKEATPARKVEKRTKKQKV
jgi:hypothetical protein